MGSTDFESRLLVACRRYAGTGYFVREAIPSKKASNARKTLGIPHTVSLMALVDCTLFGSAKDAIAFTSAGIYAKNTGEQAQCFGPSVLAKHYIVEDHRRSSDILLSNSQRISCSDANVRAS